MVHGVLLAAPQTARQASLRLPNDACNARTGADVILTPLPVPTTATRTAARADGRTVLLHESTAVMQENL